jgi:hypothetical protein
VIVLALIIIVIIIRFYLFLFNYISMNTLHDIYVITYNNYLQKSGMNFLYSSILKFIYYLSDLSYFENNNTQESLDKITAMIESRSCSYCEFYRNFYDTATLANFIYNPIIISETISNWEEIKSKTTFHAEVNYIHIDIMKVLYSKELDLIKRDIIDFLLFENYKKNPKIDHLSKYSDMLYYINYNFPTLFINIIDEISIYAEDFRKNKYGRD